MEGEGADRVQAGLNVVYLPANFDRVHGTPQHLVSPPCAQHSLRSLCMLKVLCSPFDKRRPNCQKMGNRRIMCNTNSSRNNQNDCGYSSWKKNSLQDTLY